MLRSTLCVAVVAAVVTIASTDARAFWHRYYPTPCYSTYYTPCYSACYTPCYSTCYTPCYTPCYSYTTSYCDPCSTTSCGYYVGWRPGPIRRLLFGRYRWYYGCYSTPSYAYTVSYNDYPVVYEEPSAAPREATKQPTPAQKSAPATPQPAPAESAPAEQSTAPAQPGDMEPSVPLQMPPEPQPNTPSNELNQPNFNFDPLQPSTPGTSTTPTANNSALITVWVPHDARVFVNGHETTSTGSRRQFVSYGLKPGYQYEYEVRAQVPRNGKWMEDVRKITLTAGADESVAFGFNTLPTETLASTGQ